MFPHYTAAEFSLILGALGVVLVNVINAWRQNTKLNAQDVKLDSIGQKAATIEGHVNSKETKYVEQLAAMTRENEILRDVIIDKDKTAALLAQAAVGRVRNDSIKTEVKQ
jgi:hypothetical protein